MLHILGKEKRRLVQMVWTEKGIEEEGYQTIQKYSGSKSPESL